MGTYNMAVFNETFYLNGYNYKFICDLYSNEDGQFKYKMCIDFDSYLTAKCYRY